MTPVGEPVESEVVWEPDALPAGGDVLLDLAPREPPDATARAADRGSGLPHTFHPSSTEANLLMSSGLPLAPTPEAAVRKISSVLKTR